MIIVRISSLHLNNDLTQSTFGFLSKTFCIFSHKVTDASLSKRRHLAPIGGRQSALDRPGFRQTERRRGVRTDTKAATEHLKRFHDLHETRLTLGTTAISDLCHMPNNFPAQAV